MAGPSSFQDFNSNKALERFHQALYGSFFTQKETPRQYPSQLSLIFEQRPGGFQIKYFTRSKTSLAQGRKQFFYPTQAESLDTVTSKLFSGSDIVKKHHDDLIYGKMVPIMGGKKHQVTVYFLLSSYHSFLEDKFQEDDPEIFSFAHGYDGFTLRNLQFALDYFAEQEEKTKSQKKKESYKKYVSSLFARALIKSEYFFSQSKTPFDQMKNFIERHALFRKYPQFFKNEVYKKHNISVSYSSQTSSSSQQKPLSRPPAYKPLTRERFEELNARLKQLFEEYDGQMPPTELY